MGNNAKPHDNCQTPKQEMDHEAQSHKSYCTANKKKKTHFQVYKTNESHKACWTGILL